MGRASVYRPEFLRILSFIRFLLLISACGAAAGPCLGGWPVSPAAAPESPMAAAHVEAHPRLPAQQQLPGTFAAAEAAMHARALLHSSSSSDSDNSLAAAGVAQGLNSRRRLEALGERSAKKWQRSAPKKSGRQPAPLLRTHTEKLYSECPCQRDEDEFGSQYFAMCLAVKDEHSYIREWIGYHAEVGAGTIYVYDHGSSTPLNETLGDHMVSGKQKEVTLGDHIASGLVSYHWWDPGNFTQRGTIPGKERYPQMDIYDECLQRHGHKHRFMAFLDVDEFILLKPQAPSLTSIPALLKRFQAFQEIGALVVHWSLFGSGGHITRPQEGVLQAYQKCIPLNTNPNSQLVKSIVNTKYAVKSLGAHHFQYNSSKYAVNEHMQRVDGPVEAHQTAHRIIINHYVTRSLEEYREKLKRGSASGIQRPTQWNCLMDGAAVANCNDAAHFGPYQ